MRLSKREIKGGRDPDSFPDSKTFVLPLSTMYLVKGIEGVVVLSGL